MEGPVKEKTVNFVDQDKTAVSAKNHAGEIEAAEWEQLSADVRFKTWKFKEVDDSLCDGAMIEIRPGGHTPVQYVESDTIFSEVPIRGRLLFLFVDTKGNLSIYRFDSSKEKDVSFMFEVKKGEIMSWYALKDQEGKDPAEVLEYEEPGFKTAQLPTVETNAKEVNGTPVPAALWETLAKLESGKEGEVSYPIVDLV